MTRGSGSWTVTGNMVRTACGTLRRSCPTAGCSWWAAAPLGGNGEPTASAELYDPTSGSWTATGNMVTIRGVATPRRCCPTAGCSSRVAQRMQVDGVLASAELYDPGARTWTAAGHMDTPRADQTATLLPDGQVLVAGGKT